MKNTAGSVRGQDVPLRRILVPTDFSKASKRALRYAVWLGKKLGASLTLIHVVPAKLRPSSGEEYLGLERELKDRGNEQLSHLVQKLLGHEIRANMMVSIGNPAVEIVHAAEELKAKLIIISPHSEASHLLRGSVVKTIAHFSPCPVLVVRKGEEPALYSVSQKRAEASQSTCSSVHTFCENLQRKTIN